MTTPRRTVALTAAALALTGFAAGCAASDTADVSAGVAEQYSILEQEIAAEGGDTVTGDWRIAYIVEPRRRHTARERRQRSRGRRGPGTDPRHQRLRR